MEERTNLSDSDLKEFQQLIEARSTILARLARLEEKKGAAKPAIVEKVRRDYETRLKKISEEIEERENVVKVEMDRLEKERTQLTSERDSIKDEEEEITLRYLIGEFDEETYKSLDEEKSRELDQYERKLQAVNEKIAFYLQLTEGIEKPFLLEHEPLTVELSSQIQNSPSETKIAFAEMEGKTIPCQKCGFLNKPDNWYCEKCGNELISVEETFPEL